MYFGSKVDGSTSINLDKIKEINGYYSQIQFRYKYSINIDSIYDDTTDDESIDILNNKDHFNKFSYDNILYDIKYFNLSKLQYYSEYMYTDNISSKTNHTPEICDASLKGECCCKLINNYGFFANIIKYSPKCNNRLISKIEINNKLINKYYKMMYGKNMSIDDILNT
jgi:hypothetical protein